MARTRTPSNYELRYEEPPARSNGGGKLYTVLAELLNDDKGEWAVIAECNSRSGANSILTSIKNEKRHIPGDLSRFEFTTRTNGEDNTSVLFGRTVTPGEAPAAPARRRGRPPKTAA